MKSKITKEAEDRLEKLVYSDWEDNVPPTFNYGYVGYCPQCHEKVDLCGYIDYDKEVYGDLPRFIECDNCGYYEELYGYED